MYNDRYQRRSQSILQALMAWLRKIGAPKCKHAEFRFLGKIGDR
jgi:hypothetical protein